MKLFQVIRQVPLLLLAVVFSACQSNRTAESGIRLGDKTLEQFKAGETTEEWLIAVVGPPTSRTDLPEGVSVLRYSTLEASGGPLNLILGKSSRSTATIYFVVRNGIITELWADRETERTLLGKEVEKDAGEKKD